MDAGHHLAQPGGALQPGGLQGSDESRRGERQGVEELVRQGAARGGGESVRYIYPLQILDSDLL